MSIYTETEAEEMFRDFLDEAYDEVRIADSVFYASTILERCDPIAYRVYLTDYISDLEED